MSLVLWKRASWVASKCSNPLTGDTLHVSCFKNIFAILFWLVQLCLLRPVTSYDKNFAKHRVPN